MIVLSTLLLLGTAASPASLSGSWLVNGARLELKQDGATVIGTLGAVGGPCAVPVGTELLRGSLLDDSLAAQLQLCLVQPACGVDSGSALAVLLVTNQLIGGVHATAACAADVRTISLHRPGATDELAAPAKNARLSASAPPKHRKSAPGAVGSATGATPPAERAHLASTTANTAVGQIEGYPVGAARQPGYDARDARGDRPAEKIRAAHEGPDELLKRGLAELNNGRFEAARQLFRDALALDPRRAEAYNGVGVTFYARSDFDEALAWYKRALEANPALGDAYYNIACIYSREGKKPLAFRYLRLAALNRYAQKEQMLRDPDLAPLQDEPQMAELIAQMSVPSDGPRSHEARP